MRKLVNFRTSIFITFMLVFAICTRAQMRMTHEEKLKQYQERLKFNDKQTKSVDAILLKTEEKRKSINTDDMTKRREAMATIMDSATKEIVKILTPKQRIEFKKMIEERKSKMKEMGAAHN
jgi:hypothetical protein